MAQEGFSIAGIVRGWGTQTPDAPALTCGESHQTWGQLQARCAQVATGLVAEGVGAQDRVAFLDKNGAEFFEVLFGGAMTNAVNVGVNWRLAAPEMVFIINDAEAKVLFVGTEFLPHLAAFEAELTTVKKIVVVGGGHDTHESYEDWVGRQPATDPGVVPGDEDVSMQLYTSGTTGLPKGVMLTNWNLSGLIEGAAELGASSASVCMVAMPLFHIGGSGWALVGLSCGAHSIIIREVDPVAILKALAGGVTHAFLVPAVLQFLLAVPADGLDFTRLEVMAYGASPISEAVLTKCIDLLGCDFFQLYGLTETTGGICLLRPEDHTDESHRERLRSAGKPVEGAEIRIVDTSSFEDVADGLVGEVWVRSAQNMLGYWHRDEETAKTKVEGGWLRTGDAGYLKDGYLYLHDRVKDMIVSGGENIYPAEVENALMSHPGVGDVAVVGVPSDKWGETVKAIVVKAPDVEVTEADLIAHAKTRLASYKCPTSVDWIDVLPRNPSGKILKRELRAPYWEGRERQIG